MNDLIQQAEDACEELWKKTWSPTLFGWCRIDISAACRLANLFRDIAHYAKDLRASRLHSMERSTCLATKCDELSEECDRLRKELEAAESRVNSLEFATSQAYSYISEVVDRCETCDTALRDGVCPDCPMF